MSEYDDDLDQLDDGADDESAPEPQPERNPLRAEINRLKKELKTSRPEVEAGRAAIRELAFVKAGVPVDDPKAKYFVKAYDGDLTPEAIKAAAVEAGYVEAEAEGIPAGERDAHERIANQGGAVHVGVSDIQQRIADATANRDFQTVIALKQQAAFG